MYIKIIGDNLYAKSYIFDIDGNLFTKPIGFDLQKNGKIETFVTENIHMLLGSGYDYIDNDSNKTFWRFRDFKNPDIFPQFVKDAIEENAYGPSLEGLKNAVINGDLIGINTARGHRDPNLTRGIRYAIDTLLDTIQKEQAIENLRKNTLVNVLKGPDSYKWDTILDTYLSYAALVAVSSLDFFAQHPEIDPYKVSTTKRKVIAVNDIVGKLQNNLQTLHPDKQIYHSIGFSDDEKGNVDAIRDWAATKTAKREKSNIHFVIYDTKELLKHVITKKYNIKK